jgi:hypothetical protein
VQQQFVVSNNETKDSLKKYRLLNAKYKLTDDSVLEFGTPKKIVEKNQNQSPINKKPLVISKRMGIEPTGERADLERLSTQSKPNRGNLMGVSNDSNWKLDPRLRYNKNSSTINKPRDDSWSKSPVYNALM